LRMESVRSVAMVRFLRSSLVGGRRFRTRTARRQPCGGSGSTASECCVPSCLLCQPQPLVVEWHGFRESARMPTLLLDAEAGRVSDELARRGIAAGTRVRVWVDVVDEALPMAALASSGGAFAFLKDEPDLYNDGDLIESNG